MISTRSVGLLIDTVVCLTLAKWETVSGRFGGYLSTWVVLAIAALLIILSAIALWGVSPVQGVSSDGSFAGEKPEVFGYEALDCHCRPQEIGRASCREREARTGVISRVKT